MGDKKIRWSKLAHKQLLKIIDYIEADSIQNAKKFAADVLKLVNKLPANPWHYPPDKFKNENDGSYRALELHHYRIVYRIKAGEITILRLRHTKMSPKPY